MGNLSCNIIICGDWNTPKTDGTNQAGIFFTLVFQFATLKKKDHIFFISESVIQPLLS